MNQNIWGPPTWFSLHSITFMYPLHPSELDKYNYKNFFVSYQHVLPCSVCRKNYARHLKESPIDDALKSRKDLVYWMIDLHNLVNAETGKKFMNPSKVIKRYEEIYGSKIILTDNQITNYIYENKNTFKGGNNFFFDSINSNFLSKFMDNKFLLIILIIIIIIIIIYKFIHFDVKLKK